MPLERGPAPDSPLAMQHRLAGEISIMLKYATEAGLQIDTAAQNFFASGATTSPGAEGGKDGVSLLDTPLSSLIALHNSLAKTVAPATPASLAATEPVSGWLGFLRRPPIIGWMVAASLLCAVAFVMAIDMKWPGSSVSGAGLGAAFYGLFKAHDYVRQRTWDPRYNSVYMIRFVLGVIAGIILAHLPVFDQTGSLKNLSEGVIALLGGYSAEAVNQVLQRIVDILVASVKGSGTDAAKAQVEQVKTKAAADVASTKQSVARDLSDIMTDPALPPDVRDKLRNLQNGLK